jgi:hypothetical protein
MNKDVENLRAERIAFRLNEHHILISNIYEELVDRDFILAKQDIKNLILDLRLILNAMQDDDF